MWNKKNSHILLVRRNGIATLGKGLQLFIKLNKHLLYYLAINSSMYLPKKYENILSTKTYKRV